MSLQLSVLTRNGRLDAIETIIGTSPVLKIFTGTPPANTAASSTGDLLVSMTLPSDWLLAASSGAISKNGTWSGVAGADGEAGYFRILDNADPQVCGIQGTVTETSGGGDIELNNTDIASGQTITISAFQITDGNV